jgi:hypothetical protein
MDATTLDVHATDRHIADALQRVHEMVLEEAQSEIHDARRSSILNSLASLLQRPVRAATMLADNDVDEPR